MSSKKKIIIISSSYPYGLKETFLHNEVLYLSKYFEIEIYPVIKSIPGATPVSVPPNVTFHEPIVQNNYFKRIYSGLLNLSPIAFYIRDLGLLLKKGGSFKEKFTRWFLDLLIFRTIYSSSAFRSIQSTDATIVYFYWAGQPVQLFRKLNKDIFIRVHGGEVDLERNKGYIPILKHKIIRQNNICYLPISQKAVSMLLAVQPVHYYINRLGVFNRGTNPEPQETDRIRIVSCSNLIPLKRVHLIIEALTKVNVPVEWIHFGDGPLSGKINNLVKTLGNMVSAHIMGRVKNEVIMTYYATNPIDLFINVSEVEGVPVSVMEAFSFGIPCFATDVGGTGEIVNETNGYLASKDFNISELYNYIKNVRTLSKTKQLRINARQSWQELCNATTNYQELTNVFNKQKTPAGV
jgi:glycosyltransferase involved in cell wall biosynthesis